MNKYRVGRKQGRAILFVDTGKEYLVFPQGKEEDCAKYCDYLNQQNEILIIIPEEKKYSKEEVIKLITTACEETCFNPSLLDSWIKENL